MAQQAAKGPSKRKLGRPPKDPAELRTQLLRVFFSPAEKLKLSRDATACGLGPAAYVRQLVAGHHPSSPVDDSADPQLLLELNAIGNNLNQTVGLVRTHPQAKLKWQQLHRLNEDVLAKVALGNSRVPPKQLVRLNHLGTMLNRAVADRHAGSTRKHGWQEIYVALQSDLREVLDRDVH